MRQYLRRAAEPAAKESPDPGNSHLFDMGCGRGRIAHHLATLTGGQVSGYNIDPDQVTNGIDWAARCDMSDRLHFDWNNEEHAALRRLFLPTLADLNWRIVAEKP